MPEISCEEWLAELERLSARPNSKGHTASELAEAMGVHIKEMRGRLAKLKAVGRLRIEFGKRESLDGRQSTVPLYSVVKAGKKPHRA